ncbi:hypothetical protein [Tengunoibacter tsumagoiensis]|uniref:Uncharacterized protein n=1 Tax=Tengunoibacter tsumagoiensis TaxID=2014871 RepID=A0A402A560_9CHLR|nr:hypothetical protein [Tengunoibacter tsumagoiensis]GCE14196.1 hypothetical protein KTT_40550 [Tengunoibacter tsumagoiensis]GCE14250.1 hypothetical protein KTT_41090 [Tengunoibacter tsumagoiensis]
MAISPWYKGDTAPSWTISLIPDSGTINVASLSPSSFTLLIKNTDNGVEVVGSGTFSAITAASGSTPASVVYQPSSADVASLGNYVLFLVISFPGGFTETLSIGVFQVIAK